MVLAELNFLDCVHHRNFCLKHRYQDNVITQYCKRTLQEVFGTSGLMDLFVEPCHLTIEEQQSYEQQKVTALVMNQSANKEESLMTGLEDEEYEFDYEDDDGNEYRYDEEDDMMENFNCADQDIEEPQEDC